MTYETILTERRDEVLLLTLNRPDKLNAWTPHMAEELGDAMKAGNADPGVGAMVLTGEGRAFCAGADMEDASLAEGRSFAALPPTCLTMQNALVGVGLPRQQSAGFADVGAASAEHP